MFLKDADARLDHRVDWAAALPAGVSLAASAWAVAPAEPGGVAVTDAGFTATEATARLSGGRAGHLYRVTNRVTLSDGAIDERTLIVRVEER